MSDYESTVAGGAAGPGVVPFLPDSSRLYLRVARGEMPPYDRLAQADIRLIRRWIEQGAPR